MIIFMKLKQQHYACYRKEIRWEEKGGQVMMAGRKGKREISMMLGKTLNLRYCWAFVIGNCLNKIGQINRFIFPNTKTYIYMLNLYT